MAVEPKTRITPFSYGFQESDVERITEEIGTLLRNRGHLTMGAHEVALEEEFAAYTGCRHAVSVASGTAALEIILRSLDVDGAVHGGRHPGSFGMAAAFSLFSTKVMTSGEGGLIATDNDQIRKNAMLLRDHAKNPDGTMSTTGCNWRLTELQAIVARTQLRRLDFQLSRETEIGDTHYVGVDIYDKLIEHNRALYGDNRHEFLVCDLVEDKLPQGDLCLLSVALYLMSSFPSPIAATSTSRRASTRRATSTAAASTSSCPRSIWHWRWCASTPSPAEKSFVPYSSSMLALAEVVDPC